MGLVIALVMLMLATTDLARRTTSAGLPNLPHLSLTPRVAMAGHVPAVRNDVVALALGHHHVERLLGQPADASVGAPVAAPHGLQVSSRVQRVQEDTGRSADHQGPEPRDIAEKGTLATTLAPGDWEMRPAMEADRRTARRGDEVVYVIWLTNVGTAPYTGDVTLSAHVPFGTTAHRAAKCEQRWVREAAEACGNVAVPVPGSPDGAIHEISTHAVNITLRPSEVWTYSFTVTVDGATPTGTELRNHAHFRVGDSAVQDTGAVEVTVE